MDLFVIVSIPFIAGQWSLPVRPRRAVARAMARFNPLHCGAVVASSSSSRRWRWPSPFQSPSLRGSGRFKSHVPGRPVGLLLVSIPFIAGQWSLPHGGGARRRSWK